MTAVPGFPSMSDEVRRLQALVMDLDPDISCEVLCEVVCAGPCEGRSVRSTPPESNRTSAASGRRPE